MNHAPHTTWTSWNGNKHHDFRYMVRPRTEAELCSAVANAPSVRAIGRGYSSADNCGGTEVLIDLSDYAAIVAVDADKHTIRVQAGAVLRDVIKAAAEVGIGFPALPDIDDITIGGAIASGTHGTGHDAHPLSGWLTEARVVGPDGSIRVWHEGETDFEALRVSLGVLGIFSELVFHLESLKELYLVETPVADKTWMAALPVWLATHAFVRVLWLPHSGWGHVILGDYGWTPELAALAGTEDYVPRQVPGWHAQRRRVSSWFYTIAFRWPPLTVIVNRLLAWLFFSTTRVHKGLLYDATVTKKRAGTMELAEWTVGLDEWPACAADLETALGRKGRKAWSHLPMDVRFIKGDRTWMGNAAGRDTVTVGCVSRHAPSADKHAAFAVVEDIFLAHDGRPHWAKHFASGSGTLRHLYPRWDDFVALRRRIDPEGKFLNPWLASYFR